MEIFVIIFLVCTIIPLDANMRVVHSGRSSSENAQLKRSHSALRQALTALESSGTESMSLLKDQQTMLQEKTETDLANRNPLFDYCETEGECIEGEDEEGDVCGNDGMENEMHCFTSPSGEFMCGSIECERVGERPENWDFAQCENPRGAFNEQDSRVRYSSSEVNAPATCSSETQTRWCQFSGEWSAFSGTYTHTNCVVIPLKKCTCTSFDGAHDSTPLMLQVGQTMCTDEKNDCVQKGRGNCPAEKLPCNYHYTSKIDNLMKMYFEVRSNFAKYQELMIGKMTANVGTPAVPGATLGCDQLIIKHFGPNRPLLHNRQPGN